MGILQFFKKAKRKENDEIINSTIGETMEALGYDDEIEKEALKIDNIEDTEEIEEIENNSHSIEKISDREQFLSNHCERIVEASKQIDETKVEYQAVSLYLSDMQKIDLIPMEERANLDDAARRIITLTRDRASYQNSDSKMKDKLYQNIERYEEEIPNEIKKMKENEAYRLLIKNDMRHLEGEKGSLKYQRGSIKSKQKYLKGLAIITCILIVLLIVLILAITQVFKVDVQIPFLLTIIMATASAIYIFFESRKNKYDMKLIEMKQNKAIGLLNSVKVKYINNTSVLDYTYHKFMVHNSKELEYIWSQYMKTKDEAKRYEKNTELLDFYNETLVKELKRFGISDSEIWIYQAIAIIDKKEMQEVNLRLNVRRQKLRERIDYNNTIRSRSINEIQKLLKKNPNLNKEIVEIISRYNIKIDE